MLINEQIEKMVQEKYEEAKKSGVSEISLNEKLLGDELMLFINDKPAIVFASFEAGNDKLYVGAKNM